MFVNVMCYVFRPLFFMRDEIIVKVLEIWQFLIQGHKLIICHILLYILVILGIQFLCVAYQSEKVTDTPLPHGDVKGVVEEKRTISVMDKLYESTVHQLVTQCGVAYKRDLL